MAPALGLSTPFHLGFPMNASDCRRLLITAGVLLLALIVGAEASDFVQPPSPENDQEVRVAEEYAAAQEALGRWLATLRSVEFTLSYMRRIDLPPNSMGGMQTKTEWLWSGDGLWMETYHEMIGANFRPRSIRGSTRTQSFAAGFRLGNPSDIVTGGPSMVRSDIQKAMWGVWSNAHGDWLPRFLCPPHAVPEGIQSLYGQDCLVALVELPVNSQSAGQPVMTRLFLDPTHGYLPLRADYLGENPFQSRIIEFQSVSLAGEKPLWMPYRGETSSGTSAQSEPWEWVGLKLNRPISEAQISLPAPAPPPLMMNTFQAAPRRSSEETQSEFSLAAAAPVVGLYASAVGMLAGTFWFVRWDNRRRAVIAARQSGRRD